jgi:hypothetical protein
MSMGRGWPAKKINSGAWWYCSRSGIRMNLDDAVWEQGILVDPAFSDIVAGGNFGLLGSRDADIARRIKQDTTDLMPHPKLVEPNEPDQDVYFS